MPAASRMVFYLVFQTLQASGMQACLHIPERRLSYAKISQASGMQACLHIPERRLSYAKILK